MKTIFLLLFVSISSLFSQSNCSISGKIIFQNKPIKGSCGGIAALGMGRACDICGGDTQKCEKETQAPRATSKNALAYDATQK